MLRQLGAVEHLFRRIAAAAAAAVKSINTVAPRRRL